MKITIKNRLKISNIHKDFYLEICSSLTIDNPQWVENHKMGRWNGKTPRLLRFYEKTESGLIVPRGFTGQLLAMARKQKINYRINDQRRSLPEVDFTFCGKLKKFQKKAVSEMLKKYFGTLSAATGSGKTVMALAIIAERKQPALIVVHTKELLNQWIDRIISFLGIPKDQIGVIGAGKKIIGERVTVSTVQSLYKCADKVSPYIGHLIIDESHRTPSRTFTEAVTNFDCKFMLGLSATPWRRDGLSKLIYWHIGDIAHEVDKADLIENGDILKAEIVTRETDFNTILDPSTEYSKMISELTEDKERNRLIASDIAHEAKNGSSGICLVLSDRKAHCKAIQSALNRGFDITSEVLTGDIPVKERQYIVDRLNDGEIKVLIATGHLIGEGFDCKGLSTLFLATPIRFDGRVLQYLGRVLRPAPGKDKATVFDYVDVNVPVLVSSAKARQKIYNI